MGNQVISDERLKIRRNKSRENQSTNRKKCKLIDTIWNANQESHSLNSRTQIIQNQSQDLNLNRNCPSSSVKIANQETRKR